MLYATVTSSCSSFTVLEFSTQMFLCSWMESRCCKERNTVDANICPFLGIRLVGSVYFLMKCFYFLQKLTSSWWHLEGMLNKMLSCSWNYSYTYKNYLFSCCCYYVYVLQAVGFFKARVCKAKSVCLWVVLYDRYEAGLCWALLQKDCKRCLCFTCLDWSSKARWIPGAMSKLLEVRLAHLKTYKKSIQWKTLQSTWELFKCTSAINDIMDCQVRALMSNSQTQMGFI